MRQRLRSSAFRAFTVMALLCVLAMRVAIPTGYMLDDAAKGWPRLIACPADSPVPPVTIAMHGMGHGMAHTAHGAHHHDHKSTDHPCAFAAASAAVDQAALPAADLLPHARAAAGPALHLFARPGLGLAAPPPPKTGPPALA